MSFYPENERVPKKLQTDAFVIRPLTPTHVALDYAALMDNKAMLRLWSGSAWPADDFTHADNLYVLGWHWSEHLSRIACTCTVLNPTENACLGCIYIKPMSELLLNNPNWLATVTATGSVTVANHSALVRFWTVNNLDETLLPILRYWFSTAWAFPEIYWHTPANNQPQIATFQNSGLTSLGCIQLPHRGGSHNLYK
mgnify:CR=1 FL=1